MFGCLADARKVHEAAQEQQQLADTRLLGCQDFMLNSQATGAGASNRSVSSINSYKGSSAAGSGGPLWFSFGQASYLPFWAVGTQGLQHAASAAEAAGAAQGANNAREAGGDSSKGAATFVMLPATFQHGARAAVAAIRLDFKCAKQELHAALVGAGLVQEAATAGQPQRGDNTTEGGPEDGRGGGTGANCSFDSEGQGSNGRIEHVVAVGDKRGQQPPTCGDSGVSAPDQPSFSEAASSTDSSSASSIGRVGATSYNSMLAMGSSSFTRLASAVAAPMASTLSGIGGVFMGTTAVALGTSLSVLRLGLGVVKFLVQVAVFASVLYTLLALGVDPVDRLLHLLPISEVSLACAFVGIRKAVRGRYFMQTWLRMGQK